MSQDKGEILDRLSFEEFYRGELGELKPGTNDNVLALCPFHEDRNPSLSVNLKTGLFKCFACDAQGDVFAFHMRRRGVDFKEALAHLGRMAGVDVERPSPGGEYRSLNLKEFALQKRLPEDFLKGQGVKETRFPDGVWATNFHYWDAAGNLKAIRHRFANQGDKKFRWRKGDKVGLYGLWKWDKIKAAGWCLLVEGETDCLTCWHHGLPALGMPGKKTWKRCRNAIGAKLLNDLKAIKVYLWQEPDAQSLPLEVATDLPEVMVIPAPKEFKDLSEAHGQGREIKIIVEELKKQARPPEPPPIAVEGLTLSDLGNARRLVALHGKDMHFCYLSKKWSVWTGKRWEVDNRGEVERRAKQVVGAIYQEAAETDNLKQREALGQWALRSEDKRRIQAMVTLAQSEPGIPILPQEFDASPWLCNCLNGTIDLHTGELLPHSREHHITCMAPVEHDRGARAQIWEKFVYQIMGDNVDVYEFVQRILGYALTGSTEEQCFFIFWGGGANGKSTLLNLVTRLLGNYARNTPVETLLDKKKGGEIPIDVARLDGPRLVTAKEVDRGRRLSESLIKELTGQDTVTARFLYGEYFDFVPRFKLFLCTNHKPIIRGTDNAIWRRIKLIRFPVQFPEDQWDRELPDKLWAEAPGILNWLVEGCLGWQNVGLDVPEEVRETTAEFRAEMDMLADFLADRCIIAPDNSAWAKGLYESYEDWAEDQGLSEKERMRQRSFGMSLSERGFRRKRSTHGRYLWHGLGLLQDHGSPVENE